MLMTVSHLVILFVCLQAVETHKYIKQMWILHNKINNKSSNTDDSDLRYIQKCIFQIKLTTKLQRKL